MDRFNTKLKKVVTLELSLKEKAQALGLSIAGGCGLLGTRNYGVKGNFHSDIEKWLTGTYPLAFLVVEHDLKLGTSLVCYRVEPIDHELWRE